jgi:hypothetical protein
MTDAELIRKLHASADHGCCDDDSAFLAKVAAYRLEELMLVRHPCPPPVYYVEFPPNTVRVRVAVAVNLRKEVTACEVENCTDAEALTWCIQRTPDHITHQGIAVIDVPPLAIPEIPTSVETAPCPPP